MKKLALFVTAATAVASAVPTWFVASLLVFK